jgi:CBS domain containing-hemolysin-like protein
MAKLRDIPQEGQRIEFDNFEVVVKKMHRASIVLVRIYPKP